ncbi:MAG: prepilin-type N-terminal cleavage/methylation domain-containing protein [Pseudomonadales bacterium]|nr:GspH/FimT family pseudopilin [Gammaproteobacteria bacterium]NNL56148.1 prepilin-type N-terminal cleavage/methylation domain-containing protein [Pseudomonadales bacterium]
MNERNRKYSALYRFGVGFTLLELIIVLAIAGILAAVAGPGFQSMMRGSAVVSGRDALASAVKMARGEAIYRKTFATLCASSNQATCSGGADWKDGWIVFSDIDGDGQVDGGVDTLIDVNYGDEALRIGTDGSGGTLTFAPSGMKIPAGAVVIGVCDANAASSVEGHAMSISSVGSIRYEGAAGC